MISPAMGGGQTFASFAFAAGSIPMGALNAMAEARELLDTLRRLEVELHQPAVRHDSRRLDQLLDPRFREFGRSGQVFTRADILAEFALHPPAYAIWAQDFHVEPLSDGVALLTYRSAHIDGNGGLDRHTNRASVWRRAGDGWRMVFHQGTPCLREDHDLAV